MKDQALSQALQFDDPQRRLNALREYLQEFVMRSLHESEAGRSVAFVGGTALRFLEDLPRFSEDLDFSRVSADGYEPVRWLEKLKRDLHFAGFDSTIRWIEREPVQVAWVRTAHLLAEAGLSGHARQNLSVKVEIDIRPPAGAAMQRTLVTRHFTFVVSHYDLPSLFAGKLHALLTRGYPKGRDWYDLIWYRSRRPPLEPNLHSCRTHLTRRKAQAGTERPIGATCFPPAWPAWTRAHWPATCSPSWSAPRTPPCSTAPTSKQSSPADPT